MSSMGSSGSSFSDDHEPESMKKIRDSFRSIYNGPNELHHEYTLQQAATELGLRVDDYRKLYELRDEIPFQAFPPKTSGLKNILGAWLRWLRKLSPNKKWLLVRIYGRKWVYKIIKGGAILAVMGAALHYLATIPQRRREAEQQVEQTRFQAWQLIASAKGESASGGRIEALEALAKEGVNMGGVEAPNANLILVNLSSANLHDANFSGANLSGSDFRYAQLQNANLVCTIFNIADLRYAVMPGAHLDGASLRSANLQRAYLRAASFQDAILTNANFDEANLAETIGLERDKMRSAHLCHTLLPEDLKDLSDRDCGNQWSAIPRRLHSADDNLRFQESEDDLRRLLERCTKAETPLVGHHEPQ